jgi:hypothetical protein
MPIYFIWAPNSVFHSRFFTRRTSSQKELRSSRGAIPASNQNPENPANSVFNSKKNSLQKNL